MKHFLTLTVLLISTVSVGTAQQTLRLVQGGPGVSVPAGQSVRSRVLIQEAERWLSEMGYWTGAVDGRFDAATQTAVIAFQKWEGRKITGRLTFDVLEAIRTSGSQTSGGPRAREVGYPHVEVDLDRQVMLLVNETGGVRVLPVSTGSGKEFIEDGQTSVAYTPRGRFLVYEKGVGWEKGYFGSVYYANYITGGVAIHGHPKVPAYPASHGCIRLPMFAAREVSKLLTLGTIVLVYDQVSFVSGRPWAENPKLKQAALLNSAPQEYTYHTEKVNTAPGSFVTKKPRPRIISAD